MKRVFKIALMIPAVYLLVMPLYLSHRAGLVACGGVNVVITDSAEFMFITSEEVMGMIEPAGLNIAGRPVREADLAAIEDLLSVVPEIRRSEAFRTIDGVVHVEILQRVPLVRVVSGAGHDYYIDEEGYILQRKGVYSPRVHLALSAPLTGGIAPGVNVLESDDNEVLKELYELVVYIKGDAFWSAFIDQIEVDSDGSFWLIPRAEGQKIRFGDTGDMENKFRTLSAFYNQVMPVAGWNRYSVIDVRYEGQVICKKR